MNRLSLTLIILFYLETVRNLISNFYHIHAFPQFNFLKFFLLDYPVYFGAERSNSTFRAMNIFIEFYTENIKVYFFAGNLVQRME